MGVLENIGYWKMGLYPAKRFYLYGFIIYIYFLFIWVCLYEVFSFIWGVYRGCFLWGVFMRCFHL